MRTATRRVRSSRSSPARRSSLATSDRSRSTRRRAARDPPPRLAGNHHPSPRRRRPRVARARPAARSMETFASSVASRSSHAPMVHVARFGKAERASPSRGAVGRTDRVSDRVSFFDFMVFKSLEYEIDAPRTVSLSPETASNTRLTCLSRPPRPRVVRARASRFLVVMGARDARAAAPRRRRERRPRTFRRTGPARSRAGFATSRPRARMRPEAPRAAAARTRGARRARTRRERCSRDSRARCARSPMVEPTAPIYAREAWIRWTNSSSMGWTRSRCGRR